ncbi:MAG: MFS transporter, partial [Rhodospirillaceae bacterium]
PEQNGWLFAGIGVLAALVQGGLVGRLARRFGETNLIIQGAAALSVGIALIPFAHTLPVLIVAMAVAAYGFSIITPSLNSAISLSVDAANQGTVMGVTRSATTLARVAGPAVAGGLFSLLGKDWPYYTGAAIMVLVMALAWQARRRLDAGRLAG